MSRTFERKLLISQTAVNPFYSYNFRPLFSPGQQHLLKMTTCTRLRFIMISETNSFAPLRRFSKISVYATRQQIPISRQRHAKEHYSTPKIFGTCYMECTMGGFKTLPYRDFLVPSPGACECPSPLSWSFSSISGKDGAACGLNLYTFLINLEFLLSILPFSILLCTIWVLQVQLFFLSMSMCEFGGLEPQSFG